LHRPVQPNLVCDPLLAWDENGDEDDALADIHCHCLPGVDDGPACMEDAIGICKALVADGVNHVAATPHMLGRYDHPEQLRHIQKAHQALLEELQRRGIVLRVDLAAEIRIDERIPMLLQTQTLPKLGVAQKHVLLELPDTIVVDLLPLLGRLGATGISVIIAHPERNLAIAARPQVVLPWLQAGASLQITAGSLLGDFGTSAQAVAWYFVNRGQARFVASDAHNLKARRPRLQAAFGLIHERLGLAVADALCSDNPRRLLVGALVARTWRNAPPEKSRSGSVMGVRQL
jgi:protein-tyrosine phosphatase